MNRAFLVATTWTPLLDEATNYCNVFLGGLQEWNLQARVIHVPACPETMQNTFVNPPAPAPASWMGLPLLLVGKEDGGKRNTETNRGRVGIDLFDNGFIILHLDSYHLNLDSSLSSQHCHGTRRQQRARHTHPFTRNGLVRVAEQGPNANIVRQSWNYLFCREIYCVICQE